MQLIDTHVTQAIALSILHSLWQGALIVAIIAGLVRTGLLRGTERKFAANLAGTLVLFGTAIMTFWIVYEPGQPWQEVVMPVLQPTDMPQAGESIATAQGFDWQRTVALGWAIGALLYLVRILVGWSNARGLTRRASQAGMHWQRRVGALSRRLGISASVWLCSSNETTTPFVFGVLRPVIVFPGMYFTQLTPAQIEAILLHELAHIRRHDFLVNLVQLVVESLMFFNPAIWWMGRQMRSYREFACDDKVQSTMHDKRIYLEALYRVASLKTRQPAHAVSLFHHNSELIMRVKRMLHATPQTPQLRPVATTVFGLMALIGLFLFYSGPSVSAQKTTPPPVPEMELDLLVEDLMLEITPVIDEMLIDMDAVLEIAPLVTEMTTSMLPGMEELIVDLEPVIEMAGDMAVQITEDIEPMLQMIPEMMIDVEPLVDEINAQMPAMMDVAAWPVDILQIAGDTVPPESEKVKALRKQIEQKQKEIEELTASFEAEVNVGMEQDAARIEELSEQLSALQEEHMARIEEELENSGAMQRVEELSARLEQRMTEMSEGLEQSLDEGLLRDLEQQMEEKARKYEMMDTIPPEMRKQMQEEMKQVREQMHEAMAEYRARHAEVRNDPEIQQLRQQLREAQREMRPLHQATREMWTDEAVALREQLQEMHKKMRENMNGVGHELRTQMREKAQELRELHRELSEELRKQN